MVVLRSNNLRRKIQPGGTTLLVSDSSFHLVHVHLPCSSVMAWRRSDFLSEVIDTCMEVLRSNNLRFGQGEH